MVVAGDYFDKAGIVRRLKMIPGNHPTQNHGTLHSEPRHTLRSGSQNIRLTATSVINR